MNVAIGIGILALAGYFIYASQAKAAETIPGTCGGNCMQLTYDQIFQLASDAGFGCDAGTATAIALAESSGRPLVLGDQCLAPCNGPAVGLWQINSAKHTQYSIEQLKNPATNAAQAYQLYVNAGNTFTDWTTFNNGAYQQYLR